MIDFKKELAKFKPAKTMDNFHIGNPPDEFSDIVDYLKYLVSKQSAMQKKDKGTDKEKYYDSDK